MDYAELEIGLSGLEQAGQYQVELRFDSPKDDAERTPVRGVAALDPVALAELEDGAGNAYGLALAKSLFADADVRAKYGQFKAAVEGADDSLRVKLFVDRSAPELHRLRWELLTDPDTGQPMATSERIVFSRFGSSSDWRPVRLRAKTELSALVAVSSPSNLDQYGLAPVDVDAEVARARGHLKGIRVTVAGQDAGDPLTLDRLVDGLRGGVDVLYLVCHGGLAPKGPLLYLQDADGTAKPARGDELAQRVGELVERPRLVVLASCESAGSEQVSTQSAVAAGQLVPLAPALAEAGVHAVVAMQGKISMETVKTAMPVFFAELLEDGQIDRAFAVARGKVRQQPDSWMPALFLRLKGGKIWYEPGFGDGEADFKKWEALVDAVRRKSFTPVVGPGLGESVYGPLRDLSRKLAENRFPLAEHQRSELQQVSQFLKFDQSVGFARSQFKAALYDQIGSRHGSLPGAEGLSLPKLMSLVWEKNREEDPDDPYRLLAQLDAKLFVTANPDNLLEVALRAEGKSPRTFPSPPGKTQAGEAAPTNGTEPANGTEPDPTKSDVEPDVDNPLVFHVFGSFADEASLVLTEDDYFDYLISLIQRKPRIPGVVGQQTTSTSLFFLGFQLTDWNFRVLYRLIMSQEGSSQLKHLPHVAVQIDPEEDALINPRAARKYLEDFFDTSGPEKVNIFWGTPGEFLKELNNQLASVAEAVPVAATGDPEDWS
jgi:CHAT domain/SIR2-like domain